MFYAYEKNKKMRLSFENVELEADQTHSTFVKKKFRRKFIEGLIHNRLLHFKQLEGHDVFGAKEELDQRSKWAKNYMRDVDARKIDLLNIKQEYMDKPLAK